jgi:hypothetical protein
VSSALRSSTSPSMAPVWAMAPAGSSITA